MFKRELTLSTRTRKALSVQVGEAAGTELANLVEELAARVAKLERGKVDVMPIVPAGAAKRHEVAVGQLS